MNQNFTRSVTSSSQRNSERVYSLNESKTSARASMSIPNQKANLLRRQEDDDDESFEGN